MTFESTPGSSWTESDWAIEVERQRARAERAEAVLRSLAAANPVYDFVSCFFCGALPPGDTTGCDPSIRAEGDDHDADCPWWMAREMFGLPAWPTAERNP